MSERGKTEISPQKRSLKLAPLLGDWTAYKPLRQPAKKVKSGLYGFDRLSQEEFETAHMIHYGFAQKMLHAIKTKIRASCELYSVDAQQNSYSNFTKSFTMPVYQAKFKSDNFHDEIFVSFDMQLIDALINSALGTKESSRLIEPPTDAEELVLDTVFEYHLFSFYEMFDGVLDGQRFEKSGSGELNIDKSINMQATFVYFTVELQINENLGRITVGYSGEFIKTLLKKLREKEKAGPLPLKRLNPQIFNTVENKIKVTLGKTLLSMNEIKGLETGDVVSFDERIDDAIQISLSDGHVILGQPGKSGGKFAVKVIGIEKEKAVKIEPPSIEKELENDNAPVLEEQEAAENAEDVSEEEYSDEDLEGLLSEGEENTEGTEEENLEDEIEEEEESAET
ncbi:FliM/FliN family flagellar motor switch protein [Candidatus Saganbacteria bacterium]|nr:FliM/FliN family flagellar motor switch protein [Candidatus Saganbacteria bacterium]